MRPIAISGARRQNSCSEADRNRRVTWGLSSRLPEWRAFDGRRSRIAPAWAAINETAPVNEDMLVAGHAGVTQSVGQSREFQKEWA